MVLFGNSVCLEDLFLITVEFIDIGESTSHGS